MEKPEHYPAGQETNLNAWAEGIIKGHMETGADRDDINMDQFFQGYQTLQGQLSRDEFDAEVGKYFDEHQIKEQSTDALEANPKDPEGLIKINNGELREALNSLLDTEIDLEEISSFIYKPLGLEAYYLSKGLDSEEAEKRIEGMLSNFLEWKNAKYGKYYNSPYESEILFSKKEVAVGDGLEVVLQELEIREMILKASVGTLNPNYIPYLMEDIEQTDEVILPNDQRRRSIAFQSPLERVEDRVRTDEKYMQRIIREFALLEYLPQQRDESGTYDPDAVMAELRERIRTEIYRVCERMQGGLKTTANYHVTGTITEPNIGAFYTLVQLRSGLSERLELEQMEGGENMNYKDFRIGYAPNEVQNSKLVRLSEGPPKKFGMIERGGSINHVNNVLSDKMQELALSAGLQPESLVIIDRETNHPRNGYTIIENPEKNTSVQIRYLNASRPLAGTEYSYNSAELEAGNNGPRYLGLEDLRKLQGVSIEAFVSPQKREELLLASIRAGRGSVAVELANGTDHEKDHEKKETESSSKQLPEVFMPDISGYSKIAEYLAEKFDLSAEEVYVSFIKDIVSAGERFGALSGNWAGDSMHFVLTKSEDLGKYTVLSEERKQKLEKLTPQERALGFYIAVNNFHERFLEESAHLAGSGYSDEELGDLNVDQEEELVKKIKTRLPDATDSERKELVARAFLMAKNSVKTKKYGIKTVSAQEQKCTVRTTNLDQRSRTNLNARSLESLVSPNFDMLRGKLEKETKGDKYVVSEESYNAMAPDMRELFIKGDVGYSFDESKEPPSRIREILELIE